MCVCMHRELAGSSVIYFHTCTQFFFSVLVMVGIDKDWITLLLREVNADFQSDIPVYFTSLLCIFCIDIQTLSSFLPLRRNLLCPQISNVIQMYSSIMCEMEEIENVAESVLYDLSQDNCAFAAPQLPII